MKKIHLLIPFVSLLTSCVAPIGKTVTIDGNTYKRDFYRYYGYDLHVIGIEGKEFETAYYQEKSYLYWLEENYKFPMCFGIHKDSVVWFPTLFCIDNQYDEAVEYYSDLNNFNYFYGKRFDEESYTKVEQDEYKDAIEWAIELMKKHPSKYRVKMNIDSWNIIDERVVFFRQTIDDLFCTTKEEFWRIDNQIYHLQTHFADTGETILYKLDEDVNATLIELLDSND